MGAFTQLLCHGCREEFMITTATRTAAGSGPPSPRTTTVPESPPRRASLLADRAQGARRNVFARRDGHGGTPAWIVSVAKGHVAANLAKLDESRPFQSAYQPGSVDLGQLAQAASTSTIVKWARGGGTGSPSIRSPSRWQATASRMLLIASS